MYKVFEKLILPLILLCLVKTIYNPSPIMIVLSVIFLLTYIQDKYIKDKTINNAISFFSEGVILVNNAISFFSEGVILVIAYLTSNLLFYTLLSVYSFILITVMVLKIRKYNNNIKD